MGGVFAGTRQEKRPSPLPSPRQRGEGDKGSPRFARRLLLLRGDHHDHLPAFEPGRDSTTMSSPRSASIRCAISRPSSWWLISRPRKRILTLILSPSSRKPRILRSLIW